MGGLPGSTCRSRAVAAASVALLSIWREGPAMLPTSLLMASTVFTLPRLKVAPTPVPARAVVATPITKASIIASPTMVVVALAIHVTFLIVFANILPLLRSDVRYVVLSTAPSEGRNIGQGTTSALGLWSMHPS